MSREQRERNAWEAGFRLCRAYGDNHPHFDGEQKERQWQAYWRTVSGEPTPPATPPPPSPDVERLTAVVAAFQLAAAQRFAPAKGLANLNEKRYEEAMRAVLTFPLVGDTPTPGGEQP